MQEKDITSMQCPLLKFGLVLISVLILKLMVSEFLLGIVEIFFRSVPGNQAKIALLLDTLQLLLGTMTYLELD
jgi:hypothetical protein